MDNFLTPSNIMFILGLLAILFSIYNYFKNPQIDSEKQDAIFGQRLMEIEKQLSLFVSTFQSHIQSDNTQFGMLNQHVVEVDKSVVKLTTIIEERIPKKII